ncbi:hypothetical protein ACFOMD_13740 [Sphingoaurantiacus capsulatus]|uniref:Uncharacterized protein n=1 Tax=Sphingoaurantiacus capsulatus TaxID=1771310 RepID=A0ABV7XEE0_9SPHN
MFVADGAFRNAPNGGFGWLISLPTLLLLGFVAALPIAVEALPWVSAGTILSFWPLCRFFRERTARNLLIVLLWGATMGAVFGLYAVGTRDLGGGEGPVGPWVGAFFGLVTAAFGRGLMGQDVEDEDNG